MDKKVSQNQVIPSEIELVITKTIKSEEMSDSQEQIVNYIAIFKKIDEKNLTLAIHKKGFYDFFSSQFNLESLLKVGNNSNFVFLNSTDKIFNYLYNKKVNMNDISNITIEESQFSVKILIDEVIFYENYVFEIEVKRFDMKAISKEEQAHNYSKLVDQINEQEKKIKELNAKLEQILKEDEDYKESIIQEEINNNKIIEQVPLENPLFRFYKDKDKICQSSININEAKTLREWFQREYKLDPIYKASKMGFKSENFHSKLDDKTNLLFLCTTVRGNRFGAFSPLRLNMQESEKSTNNEVFNTFLFSLDANKMNKYPLIPNFRDKALFYDKKFLLCFGNGYDLLLKSECNIQTGNQSNLGRTFDISAFGLNHGDPKAKELLAGEYQFRLQEIEVFQVELN